MGLDHTTTGSDDPSENVERTPPADRPPPPPPDKPGTEGYPSRADSRAGAAAANTTDQPTETSASGEAHPDDAATTSSNGKKPETSDSKEPAVGGQPNETKEPTAKPTDDARPNAAAPEQTADQPTTQYADAVGDREDLAPADRPAMSVAETADGRDGTSPPGSAQDTRGASAEEPVPPGSSSAVSEVVREADGKSNADAVTTTDPAKSWDEAASPEARLQHTVPSDMTGSNESERLSGLESQAVTRGFASDIGPAAPSEEVPPLDRQTHPTAEQAVDAERSKTADPITSPEPTAESPPEVSDRQADGVTIPEDAIAMRRTDEDAQDRPKDLTEEVQAAGADLVAATGTGQDASALVDADRSEPEASMSDSDQVTRPRKYDILVQDLPLEAYLDRTAGDYRPADQRETPLDESPDGGPIWVEKRSDLPRGDELRDMDSDKMSRLDRLRKEGYKKLNDALDVTEKGFDLGVDAFGRPPTHSETRSVEPHVVEAPHHGVTAGEAATGLLAAGVVVGEALRAAREKMLRRKRERNADSR